MNYKIQNIKSFVGDVIMKISSLLYKICNKNKIMMTLLRIYNSMLSRFNMTIFPIVNAKRYKFITNNVDFKLLKNNREGVSSNIIMAGSNSEVCFKKYKLTDLYLKHFKNVCIRGNSDMIVDINNGYVINEMAYNSKTNEKVIDGLLWRYYMNVGILNDNLKHNKIEMNSGIMISGKLCSNYYHSLYENLIRLILLKRTNIPENVPIIIDEKTIDISTYKNIIDILTKDICRDIICIGSHAIYHFNELYYIDHINKIPSHLLGRNYSPDSCLYDVSAIVELRDILLRNCSDKRFPKRVFITRASTKRRNFNENEVYKVLQGFGFEKITPELLTFEEQVSLFHHAEYIVAGSGAALTNLMFVTEKCNVICFGISSNGNEIPVFNTIANINGAKFVYFPRKTDCNGNVHSNFEIDCSKLQDYLQELLKQN